MTAAQPTWHVQLAANHCEERGQQRCLAGRCCWCSLQSHNMESMLDGHHQTQHGIHAGRTSSDTTWNPCWTDIIRYKKTALQCLSCTSVEGARCATPLSHDDLPRNQQAIANGGGVRTIMRPGNRAAAQRELSRFAPCNGDWPAWLRQRQRSGSCGGPWLLQQGHRQRRG
jgi:hypothetical protein